MILSRTFRNLEEGDILLNKYNELRAVTIWNNSKNPDKPLKLVIDLYYNGDPDNERIFHKSDVRKVVMKSKKICGNCIVNSTCIKKLHVLQCFLAKYPKYQKYW